MKRFKSFKKLFIFCTVFVAMAAFYAYGKAQASSPFGYDPRPLTEESKAALSKLSDYSTIFLKQELFGNKMSKVETIELKFRKPNDVYMKWVGDANKGQEALYRKGFNENRVKAHKGGLLNVVNVNCAPEGKLAMDGQHHRIVDAGIGPTSLLVYRGMLKGIERNEVKFVNHGIVKENGKDLIKIEAQYPEKCEGVTHTVAKGESLWDLAKKYDQDMYVILHNNKGVDSPTDVKEGQKILVPYHYCRKAITWTDSKTKLLTKLEIYDWNNKLYEYYEFKDFKSNVGLSDKDFDPKNPDYKF
jgi:outer membrane lipoprotein-sorting protein